MLENGVERALRKESRAGRADLTIAPVESSLVFHENLCHFFQDRRSKSNSFVHVALRGVF